jgi:hypothetical protein
LISIYAVLHISCIGSQRLLTSGSIHWEPAATVVERERFVNKLELAFSQFQISRARIFGGMRRTGGFGNRKQRGTTDQEAERDLAGSCVVRRSDFAQYAASGCARAGKGSRMPEGAVAHDGDTVLLAPGNHGMLDRPVLQMVEHLVAGDSAFAGDAHGFVEVGYVEIANAPRADFSVALKPLEARDRLLQRMRTAPVQQVAVEPLGLQPRE